MSYGPWFSVTLGRFTRGEYEAAAEAAQKAFQANPCWSSAHYLLAATHTRLGRLDAARAAAMRVLELEPGFTISGTCAAFDISPVDRRTLERSTRLGGTAGVILRVCIPSGFRESGLLEATDINGK
jgi:adenylate cyclase